MIIPVFLPMQGCSSSCVFCDQHAITATPAPSPIDVETLVKSRNPDGQPAQLAFYGGSFTALPRTRLKEYVDTARRLRSEGLITGFRCSTRPDAIHHEVLDILQQGGCEAIELGVQSTDIRVQQQSGRIPTDMDQLHRVVAALHQRSWQSVIQLMPGLPGEDQASFLRTITDTIALSPHGVRLYPTLVLRGTTLHTMYESGHYTPLDLEQAIQMCSRAVSRFRERGIHIVRMGLQDGDSLRETIVAGPWHPAFGELVESRLCLQALLPYRESAVALRAHPRLRSKIAGHKRQNLTALQWQALPFEMDEQLGIKEVSLLLDSGQWISLPLNW